MQVTEKTKLCQFCEGNIPLSVTSCPYCGAHLNAQKKEEKVWQEDLFTKDEFTKRFSPPYVDAKERVSTKKAAPVAIPPLNAPIENKEETNKSVSSSGKRELFMLVCLALGAHLLALGLIILIFATEGELVLRWQVRHVFVHFSFATFFLAIGYFFYQKIFSSKQ